MNLLFQGDKIHVFVRKTLIYKFQNHIFEDKVYSFNFFSEVTNSGFYRTTRHKYKINFKFGTKVSYVGLISCAIPQYTPMSVIRAPGFDTHYLVGKFTYNGFGSTYLFPYVLTYFSSSRCYWFTDQCRH